MTAPLPITAPAAATEPQLGRIDRWRLTEPVRLYLYTLLVVLTAALQLAGWMSGEWAEFAAANGAVVLAVGTGAEAARASVYSPASMVRAAMRAAGQ